MRGRSHHCLLAIVLVMSFVARRLPAQDPQTRSASPDLPARLPIPRPFPLPPPVAPTFGFPQLSRAAGTIFSGRVISISRAPLAAKPAVEVVAITFHVENSIRGAIPGENLTIYQWMGAWSGGQRYRVGERLLVFLYPPSKLGLTSTVAGPLGRFALDAQGRVLLSGQQLSAFQRDPVLGGKSLVGIGDFARAVQRTRGEE